MGRSGVNLIFPLVSTLVDTVTMTARAEMRPLAETMSTPPVRGDVSICVTGAESLDRQTFRKLHQQRAEALPAESVDVALGRFREIHRRDLAQILAAAERPEKEFDRRLQVAKILRQRLQAGHVDLAARGILDRAVAAHERGQKILELALARIAAADAQPLPRRGRIDIEPGGERELRDRIDVRHVDPVRAEIDRHAEKARIGEAAPAGAARRLPG